MKKVTLFLSIALFTQVGKAQFGKDLLNNIKNSAQHKADSLKHLADSLKKTVINKPTPAAGLTNEEVIQGLREALTQGSNKSGELASKADGFYKNPRLFIPFPPEAEKMKKKLVALGMKKKVDDFETSLNRAAEEAAKSAAPVFIDAIKGMSIGDGFAILKGTDTAATQYLREKTNAALIAKFLPITQAAIEKVKVTSYWTPLVTKYNKLPGVVKQNPDLNAYVTQRAIQGLFLLVKDEEANIRKNPAARASEILKKVFGSIIK